MQQYIERLHATIEYPYIYNKNGYKKNDKKTYEQIENRFTQILLFNGWSRNRQFVILSRIITEDCRQNSSRFCFLLFCNINHGILIADALSCPDIRFGYFP